MKHIITSLLVICTLTVQAQRRRNTNPTPPEPSALEEMSIGGLKFRNVGPAITSGRISDFAVNPTNPKEYYVATSSGGVWKTTNGGTTYKPLFDGQGSYSIGVVTLDPHNPNVVWVGTGENNNQRSVAYGDGLYKSEDGGASWKHMGLKESEHIGSVVVDAEDSDRIYVAAIGPLWSSGGDRGLYLSDDGGATWRTTLTVDEHTGVNEVHQHPTNPDILYATTYQRRRHVFTYLGGGPGSAIYRSTDRGESWEKINTGLPSVDLGRIGLAISPVDPEVVYAIVEAAQGKGGFYRSTNRGARWEKRGGYSTSGNYYQEIIADPVDVDKVYAMNTWMAVTTDGGKSFSVVGEDTKHVDNHCMWIDPTDTDHYMVGCDGGIYETWDAAATWQYKPNLPVTQFYKVAVDNDEPFYNIYGGTQDNFSMGGPSRTTSGNSIVNSDWYMTHGGDGFESQVDPTNPNIVYAQSQYGFLVRYDRQSGEEVGIKPQPGEGENQYRWNWDAPLHISAHNPQRIYFSANKVFKSDDRGNSWQVISDELSRNLNRNELPIMGRIWGIDAVAKNGSTSPYGTIVAFHESPLNEDLLVVGTDDGLIQITTDGGQNWRQVDNLPGAPERSYVNAVLASQHDENVIYAAFNHHKYGDFKPYVYRSADQGRSWTKISSNLPERGSAYSLAEDHESADLLFVGTEFGVFFSPNTGGEWKQLKAGLPTVAVRDIAIQARDNDLVLATFGRGFYVLDDYSPLRSLTSLEGQESALLALRDPWIYVERYPLGLPGQGFQVDSYYTAENLGPVAMFTYYLKEAPKSQRDARRKAEAEAQKDGQGNPYPSYEELKAEGMEEAPFLLFTIKNSSGDIVRKLKTSPSSGLNRITWDMRYASDNAIDLSSSSFYNPFAGQDQGTLVSPGQYSVSMALYHQGTFQSMSEEVSFMVKPLDNSVLPAQDREAKLAFQRQVSELSRRAQAAQQRLGEVNNQIRHMEQAVLQADGNHEELFDALVAFKQKLNALRTELYGDGLAGRLDQDTPPSVSFRIGMLEGEQLNTTSAPTASHRASYAIAAKQLDPIVERLTNLISQDLVALQDKLEAAGAPYTPYQLGKE
ncbi:MAG: glycosyl hydrolase [Bacteroidota bacterium]